MSRRKECLRRTRGAAMVEALLSYFILFLVLFGMLHIFYFFTGQFFVDYAALRGARSRAVGFNDYLVKRELRINAIGGSGALTYPELYSSGTGDPNLEATQFTMEKTLIQRYMVGAKWLEYEFWPTLDISLKNNNGSNTVQADARFRDYSFPIYAYGMKKENHPERKRIDLFFNDVDLKGSASLGNHSSVYLED